ncbi:MAG: cytotoxic translational repressor of toxin-antitoxin stability system [Desertifilum sp. SIO1I2]|nr:cytotoxic translational repressor of toxin-antitoxin stability system [Desertifilum sp. SIO1I2]
MKFEVRYARSFLQDLKSLKTADYQRVYTFVFIEFTKLQRLYDLQELRQLGSAGIFYRFSLDRYLIAIEVTGHFIKFIRILPKPPL